MDDFGLPTANIEEPHPKLYVLSSCFVFENFYTFSLISFVSFPSYELIYDPLDLRPRRWCFIKTFGMFQ